MCRLSISDGGVICWVPPSWALRISWRHTFSTKWIKSLLCKIISMTWRTLRLSSISCGHAWDCAKSCSCSALSLLDLPQRPLSVLMLVSAAPWKELPTLPWMTWLGNKPPFLSTWVAWASDKFLLLPCWPLLVAVTPRELALHLLGADPDDPVVSDYIPSSEESQAREQLRLILPDLLHPASQCSIQRALDSLSFTSLKASLCLRDQARLNTIASPHAGAWLQALPNPLLGLAMPQQEFCGAIRLWLGVKLFPSPPSPSAAPAGK